ncbi:hypothetical protein CR513_28184, partial [Mucuna pruriens]
MESCNDDEGNIYEHMTTNLSKYVNKVLKCARNLPITTLVKGTYGKLVEYFVQMGARARSELGGGQMYNIESITFEVVKTFNLVTQRECGAFQAFRYPCSHVIAAWSHFVDVSYLIKNIVDAYSRQWFLVGNNANIFASSGPKLFLISL